MVISEVVEEEEPTVEEPYELAVTMSSAFASKTR
uniref:Uncharacterized protein n=1 Tax=Arundo donax TaxID=35708 RepID=A0A0A9BFF5_ARUDO